jgi:hypothetical protein
MTIENVKVGDKVRVITGGKSSGHYMKPDSIVEVTKLCGNTIQVKGKTYRRDYLAGDDYAHDDGVREQFLVEKDFELYVAKPALDLTKPLQMKNGKAVQLVHLLDKGKDYPIRVYDPAADNLLGYSLAGEYIVGVEDSRDLINVPEKVVVYKNLWDGGTIGYRDFESAEEAQKVADEFTKQNPLLKRIACARVEFVVGQFDE